MHSPQASRAGRWGGALLALGLAVWTAGAADLVLHIPGVAGDSTTPGHAGDIELRSLQFAVTNPDRTNASYSEVTLTKYLDKSSVPLSAYVAGATNVAAMTIYQTRTNGTGTNVMTLQLNHVYVTSYTTGITADDGRPTESLILAPASLTWSYAP